ncbi:AAA family ATPase [Parafilimonas sp.]|uniref:AAA family ATPase n=1 Tax=Parafilimonas sp. TaxID=1969739 RepID=UPI0039E69CE2
MANVAINTDTNNANNLKPVPLFEGETFEEGELPIRLSNFEHLRITAEKDYPNNEPVITWDGCGIAAPGNLTAISAQAKAGKTAFCSMLMAGALSIDGCASLFGGIEIAANVDTKAVLNFDTEQAEADQQHNVKTVLKRLELANTPDHFLSYNIRQLSIVDYKQTTDAICSASATHFGGIYAIFIDGAADYIKDVNSTEQATEIREYFTHLAIRYQCPVILVIHQNPGSTKERGHLGSEIQRKCYGIISITKEDEISIAKTTFSRKAGDLQSIHFKYSIEKGYHVEVDAPASNQQKNKLKQIESCMNEVLGPLEACTYMELVRKIIAATACSEPTAKRYINVSSANNWIIKGQDDRYRLQSVSVSTGIKQYQT